MRLHFLPIHCVFALFGLLIVLPAQYSNCALAQAIDSAPPMLPGADHAMYLNNVPLDAKEVALDLLPPFTDPAWHLYNFNPAQSFKVVEGTVVRVKVTTSGAENWHVQYGVRVTGLQEGVNYFLTGQVRADSSAPLTLRFSPKSDPKRTIGLNQALKPTPEWRSFRYFFQARGTVGEECYLQLMQGLSAGNVSWSHLQLRAETPSQSDARAHATELVGLNGRWPLEKYHTYAGVSAVRRRYLIAPLRFANTRDKFVQKREDFNRLFSNEWPGMGHYWRAVSYGKVRVEGEAVDWIDLLGNWQDYCETVQGAKVFDRQKLADEVSKRYSMRDFDAVAFFPNIRDERTNATSVTVKMQGKVYPGIYCPDYGISVQVCAHETGHAFGFDHTFVTPGQRDTWDVMGAGGSWGNKHLVFGAIPSDTDAYHKMMAGWIAEPQILRIGPGMEREFHLERLAEPTQDRYLAVVIKSANAGNRFWTLEARMRAGYDMGAIQREGVVCHDCDPNRRDPTVTIMNLSAVSAVVDTDNNGNLGDEGAGWDVGKTYVNTQYHFSVTVLSRDATGYVVRVKVDP